MSGPATPEGPPARDESDAAWDRPPNPWPRLRARLRGNYQLAFGGAILLGFLAAGLLALVQFHGNLTRLSLNPILGGQSPPPGPSAAHPLGVLGGLGVDELQALWQATPVDLALVGGSTLLAAGLGIVVGSAAGLRGGLVDAAVVEVSDLLVGVPPFFFVMVLFLGLQPFLPPADDLLLFGVLFAVVLFPYHARPVRARALEVAGEPYVEAAKAAGAGPPRLLLRHVLPNATAPVLAQLPIDVYNFLFVLTVFPFLNCFDGSLFAVLSPLPTTAAAQGYPEWGFLLARGACAGWSPLASLDYPWMYLAPGAVVILFGIAVTLAADGFDRFLAGGTRST